MSLDDYPIRDDNSELAEISETRFESEIRNVGQFVTQQKDRHDYGTDYQIEATQSGGMTNCRVHVQLKGTDREANADGSVSISVDRTNLNYLLSQPNSIYVCFHAPTDSLLVRSAEDVFRDYEHRDPSWRSQASVTIRFYSTFDATYQATLKSRTLANSKMARNDRLGWIVTPPDQFVGQVRTSVPTITVPESADEAVAVLTELHQRGEDAVISKAFVQFAACLGADHPRLTYAYLSEINLAMRGEPFDANRVRDAIRLLEATQTDNAADVTYCRANGHLALDQREEAMRLYRAAIDQTNGQNDALEAQCWKNLGSTIELEGDNVEARRCYELALQKDPDLMEAHYALGLSYREDGNLQDALQHLNQVIWAADEVAPTIAVRGRRLEVYFRLGQTEKAFDEVAAILPHSDVHKWILPWCAQLVFNYARTNPESVVQALKFWDTFRRKQPGDRAAQKERLLCLAHAKTHGQDLKISLQQYMEEVASFRSEEQSDAALLWDRVGHWAQVDENWEQAEVAYRKAFDLEPDRYGYCLGTALNFLKRFEESLPILLEQARVHQPDAMSWFQVAIAQEGTGDIEGCIESYHRTLELDADYDVAWFNLGGVFWNRGDKRQAISIWSEALARFPSHPLAAKLRREMGPLFGEDDG